MAKGIPGIIRGTSKGANDSSHMRGWVVGHMHEGLAGTTEFEVKLWQYDEPFEYGVKSFGGTEFIVIYAGRLRFELEDEAGNKTKFVLDGEKKEYVFIPKGLKKHQTVEVAPAFGVTVRWPSGPGVNRVL